MYLSKFKDSSYIYVYINILIENINNINNNIFKGSCHGNLCLSFTSPFFSVHLVHWFIFKSDSKDRYRWCFSSISQETFFVIAYTDPAILHYIVFIICQFPLTRISLVRFVSRSLVLRSQRAFIEENGKLKTLAWVWAIKVILQTCLRPTWLTFCNGSGSSSFGHKIGCGSTWRPHRNPQSRANTHNCVERC